MKSLVKRAQRGDDQAFVELIEENKQAMYKVAIGILKNDSDAADAIEAKLREGKHTDVAIREVTAEFIRENKDPHLL